MPPRDCAQTEDVGRHQSRPASPGVVNVELYGVIRDLVKDSRVELRLPDREGASYLDVLEALANRFGPSFRDRLFGSHGPLSFVKVYSGGKAIVDLDQALPAQDDSTVRIIVFAAAGGG